MGTRRDHRGQRYPLVERSRGRQLRRTFSGGFLISGGRYRDRTIGHCRVKPSSQPKAMGYSGAFGEKLVGGIPSDRASSLQCPCAPLADCLKGSDIRARVARAAEQARPTRHRASPVGIALCLSTLAGAAGNSTPLDRNLLAARTTPGSTTPANYVQYPEGTF